MNKQKHKSLRRTRRRIGIRKRIIGTADRPRLSIYRSLNHMYAQ
ncbi:MAG: 50S ribosomal protein L18, partial [Phycisphaerales bacterium]|nr:50S ribosomal protein L18 [Phycisphaerales bacterium]